MVISIICSVVLGLMVAFVTASAMQLFASGEDLFFEVEGDGAVVKKKFAGFNQIGDGRYWAFGAGAITGLINYFTPVVAKGSLPGIGVAFLIIMAAFYVGMMVWWAKEGSSGKELVPFIILGGLMYLPTVSAAMVTTMIIPNVFWQSVIMIVPAVLLVVAFGFMIANIFYFRYKEMDETVGERKRDLALTIVVSVVAGLLTLGLLATNVAWGQIPSGYQTAYGAGGTATDQSNDHWYKFYNSDLQNDGDASNDYNFGPNPYVDGKDAKYYDADFRERLKKDPALAAASTAWLDANVGTRYLGEFYESCQGDWAKTMNAAKDGFMNNGQDAYTKNLNAFFKYLDSATKVEIRECRSVSDQMYMNPYTADGAAPDIIVLLTDDHSGHELVYTFEIKGSTFEVAYRIECGYQPTDVAEIMGITPQDKSTVTPSNPDNPSPSPSPNPPGPTPDPEPKKDPSKLTPINTEPNDNRGPGENTIGDDPNHSTKDRADNSTSFPSYDAYREYMDYLAEVNQTQRVGGDSNQPSTETPTGTTVDNNAANGTGYGGIDTPTPVSPPAETASGGAITNNSSNAATAWGDGNDPI